MRTYEYTSNELNFLASLAFYDVMKKELEKRAGVDIGNKVWDNIGEELALEFDLN